MSHLNQHNLHLNKHLHAPNTVCALAHQHDSYYVPTHPRHSTWSKVNLGSPLGQPWVPDFWVDIRGSPHKNRQPWVPATISLLRALGNQTKLSTFDTVAFRVRRRPDRFHARRRAPPLHSPCQKFGNTDYFLKIPAKSTMRGSMKLCTARSWHEGRRSPTMAQTAATPHPACPLRCEPGARVLGCRVSCGRRRAFSSTPSHASAVEFSSTPSQCHCSCTRSVCSTQPAASHLSDSR